MTETYAQILPDSTGDKIRTLQNTVGGNVVGQQVVSIANERGALMPTDELLTAFGSQRVATPTTLFDSKFLYDKQDLFWAEALTGSGSASQANSMVTMGVTSGTDSATRQTKMSFNYQSGKSQLILLTGVFSMEADVTKRAGYYNGTDGVFLKVTGTGVRFEIMIASAVSETAAQASWNLDTLDGSGPSGITLDLTKVQIVLIDFQWLGAGTVRCGFVIGGRIVYAHAFHHANVLGTSPYMTTPNLPVRYSISSSGGAGTMAQICCTVISEGGSEERGLLFGVDMGTTAVTLPASGIIALIAVRLLSGRLGAAVEPIALDALLTATGSARWSLILNPSIAGTALTWATVTGTSMERALGIADNVCTGGTIIESGYVGTQTRATVGAIKTTLRLGSDLTGTPVRDVLVLAAVNVATTPPILASMQFRELL
jgi:hypothetical protein